MEWNEILSIPAWTPLSEIACSAVPVMDGIFMVGQNAYIKTQTYNRSLEIDDHRAPFVTKAYWAPCLDALKRAIYGDPSFGTVAPLVEPPQELVLGTSGVYSELIQQVFKGGGKNAESAIYSNTGAFLYRVIKIGRFNYCFLSNEDNGDDRTFLIDIALPK